MQTARPFIIKVKNISSETADCELFSRNPSANTSFEISSGISGICYEDILAFLISGNYNLNKILIDPFGSNKFTGGELVSFVNKSILGDRAERVYKLIVYSPDPKREVLYNMYTIEYNPELYSLKLNCSSSVIIKNVAPQTALNLYFYV